MVALAETLADLRADSAHTSNFVAWHHLSARSAVFGRYPDALDPHLGEAELRVLGGHDDIAGADETKAAGERSAGEYLAPIDLRHGGVVKARAGGVHTSGGNGGTLANPVQSVIEAFGDCQFIDQF